MLDPYKPTIDTWLIEHEKRQHSRKQHGTRKQTPSATSRLDVLPFWGHEKL